MRATSRMCDVSINTVTKLLVDVGTARFAYHDKAMRDLPCKRLQCDEIWSFCYSKEKKVAPEHKGRTRPRGRVDLDGYRRRHNANRVVHGRSAVAPDARYFMRDLAHRLTHRVQLTTDGHKAYLGAVEDAFGADIDFAMLVKLYGPAQGNQNERRDSQGTCSGAIKGAVCGEPDERQVSTSYVERQNLTMRMGMRRFTRLTNGVSKKVQNLECAVALHFMHYKTSDVSTSPFA